VVRLTTNPMVTITSTQINKKVFEKPVWIHFFFLVFDLVQQNYTLQRQNNKPHTHIHT